MRAVFKHLFCRHDREACMSAQTCISTPCPVVDSRSFTTLFLHSGFYLVHRAKVGQSHSFSLTTYNPACTLFTNIIQCLAGFVPTTQHFYSRSVINYITSQYLFHPRLVSI
jgi:hypothetical protein